MLWISGLVQDKQNKSTTTEDDPFDVNEVIDNDRVIEEGDIDESVDDDSEDLAIDTETEVEEPSNSRYKVLIILMHLKMCLMHLFFWWEERDKIALDSLKFYATLQNDCKDKPRVLTRQVPSVVHVIKWNALVEVA